ncbi:glycosyltransferase family 2 protein [Lysobacter sp. TAF61]|uniref:glycosyltransferase family 2 protein n=1 Tax=Lysobacter sp. TAF61 TaxID=3233072 RepID=UPI003F972602
MVAEVRTCGVVVTYYPMGTGFTELARRLLPQLDMLVVVDNTPEFESGPEPALEGLGACAAKVRVVRLGANRGLASALNAGIEIALKEDCRYVLLSDQDSLPADNMVEKLIEGAVARSDAGERVGCVCPTYFDRVSGQIFPFQVQLPGRLFYTSTLCETDASTIEVLTGITSGSLIPASVFPAVGGMRDDLFIDYIDTEWCHRARSLGFKLYGSSLARLEQHLGEETFPIWLFGWRPYSSYSPQRLYYRIRNFLLLLRMRHIQWRWKVRASAYWLTNIYAYLLFSPARRRNLGMVARAILDGIRGRAGEFEAGSRRKG